MKKEDCAKILSTYVKNVARKLRRLGRRWLLQHDRYAKRTSKYIQGRR